MADPAKAVRTAVVPADGAEYLDGDDLLLATLGAIDAARARLWIAMFLTDLSADDPRRSVRYCLDAVVRAARRDVDVRVLVDTFERGPARLRTNATAAGYLDARRVAVRERAAADRSSAHSKYVVADGEVIVGSGNWTVGGLDRNVELALHVRSDPLAADLARRFAVAWHGAQPVVLADPLARKPR